MKKLIFLVSVLTVIAFSFPGISHGAQATLAWDANPVWENVTGYKLYYGIAPRTYTWFIDVGNVTTYMLDNLAENVIYYVSATAYDIDGFESLFSTEVMVDPFWEYEGALMLSKKR